MIGGKGFASVGGEGRGGVKEPMRSFNGEINPIVLAVIQRDFDKYMHRQTSLHLYYKD